MKQYIGRRAGTGELQVYVEDDHGRVPLRHHVVHSPTGFECGYGGSGPADLARCILIDYYGFSADIGSRRDLVLPVSYQDFKFAVVAKLPRDEDWTITVAEVEAWVESQRVTDPEDEACTCGDGADPGDHEPTCPQWREATRAGA